MTQKQDTLKSTLEDIIKKCYENYKLSEQGKKDEFSKKGKKDELSEKNNFRVFFTGNTINISIHPGNPHSGPKFYKLIEEIDEKVEEFLSNEGYKLEEKKFIYDHYIMSFGET